MTEQLDAHCQKFRHWKFVEGELIARLERQIAYTDELAAARAARTHPVKAGELFVLTSGEYSSYQIVDVFRAKADFDIAALEREDCDTAAELVKRDLAEQIDHTEINLDYL